MLNDMTYITSLKKKQIFITVKMLAPL